MQIARSLDQRLTEQPVVLTIGKFDGVHIGHARLIRTTVQQAGCLGFASAVLTWEPHPNAVLRPGQELRLLTSLDERIELIGSFGPDFLIVAPFTRETMATPAAEYIRQICSTLPVREIWVGAGFALGRAREGDVPRLMEIGRDYGFAVCTVAPALIGDTPVSASRVRTALDEGDVVTATTLLGRPFGLSGTVVEGDKRGRQIGFPTANLVIDAAHILPADGVYACHVHFDNTTHPAVTNIGVRPTFAGVRRTVEAHLLDWSGDLYGQRLRIDFLHRLRGEQKFNGIGELVAQIGRDAARARELLR